MKVLIDRSKWGVELSQKRESTLNKLLEPFRGLGNVYAPVFFTENSDGFTNLYMEYNEIPTNDSVITLFGMYYSLDTGWFYLTNPREVSGVPVISFRLLLAEMGRSVPSNLNDLILHYKLTGKVEELAAGLFGQTEYSAVPIIRYLIQARVDSLLGRPEELLKRLLIKFRDLMNFTESAAGWFNPSDREVTAMVMWLNMRSTMLRRDSSQIVLQNTVDQYDRMRKDVDRELYLSSCPGWKVSSDLTFTEMKALNTYDVVRAEHLSRDDLIYFDAPELSAEGLQAFTLVDGRERNAAVKAVQKYAAGKTFEKHDRGRKSSVSWGLQGGSSLISLEILLLMKGFNIIRSAGRRLEGVK